jgi:hypothetical protein
MHRQAIHVDEEAVCSALGVPYTAENAEIIQRITQEAISELWGITLPCQIIDEREDPCK